MEHIRNAFEKTLQELDPCLGYQESVFHKTMLHFLRDQNVQSEVIIPYCLTNGHQVGYGRADLILETDERVFVVELKRGAVNVQSARSQVKRYVKHFQTAKPMTGVVIVFSATSRVLIV